VDRTRRYETFIALARTLAMFGALLGIVTLLGWGFRDELSRFGAWFVARFGIAGMAFGAFLADGLHFPIPPQFYMLTGIAGGHAATVVLLAVLTGSVLGGLTAFALARTIGQTAFVARRLESSRRLLIGAIERRGYLGLAAATLHGDGRDAPPLQSVRGARRDAQSTHCPFVCLDCARVALNTRTMISVNDASRGDAPRASAA
jgi:membrane protein YqaA with SNARE-associated domain